MANEIHNYPLQIYSLGDLDFMDVDTFNGVDYDSAKILGRDIRAGKATMITNSSTVTGTGEQSFLDGTFIGSLSVPANGFQVGDSFRIKICGYIGAHNNDTITIRIKSGTTILSASPAITMPSIGSEVFELESNFTIRAIGPAMSASIMTNSTFTWNKASANIFEGQNWLAGNSTTFDTTILNTLDITAQWSSGNASNHIMAVLAHLEKSY
jgi:hypothetical protein